MEDLKKQQAQLEGMFIHCFRAIGRLALLYLALLYFALLCSYRSKDGGTGLTGDYVPSKELGLVARKLRAIIAVKTYATSNIERRAKADVNHRRRIEDQYG